MSEALPLPGMESLVLTERQALALSVIRERGPLSSEDLGRALREARGGRGDQWDTSNGRSVAESLRERGFCRRVRVEGRMLWCSAEWRPELEAVGYDPARSEIPY